MNGRKLFREFAQHKGREATEFVRIDPEYTHDDTLITKDSKGKEERTSIDYREMINWIIRTKKLS